MADVEGGRTVTDVFRTSGPEYSPGAPGSAGSGHPSHGRLAGPYGGQPDSPGTAGQDDGWAKTEPRRPVMVWWGWVILLIAVAGLLVAAAVAVQARRRSGTVIAVRSDHRAGREGSR
ncbi:hypothetical protein Srubr_28830 [Streptomyces rubradiris]|uniref:MYXO-CTERM domain-containing protein n=1 Tax=Streptomyces rubradiris TaxID=285531 RepID=A0ABQ3RB10_STRRR|nr:hypothetical protein GCM10018792_51710 [Streptomyces rubradiris]GHI53037.1 hypothetical protein Srubr_28830 [Streptomyces rubradiris]